MSNVSGRAGERISDFFNKIGKEIIQCPKVTQKDLIESSPLSSCSKRVYTFIICFLKLSSSKYYLHQTGYCRLRGNIP